MASLTNQEVDLAGPTRVAGGSPVGGNSPGPSWALGATKLADMFLQNAGQRNHTNALNDTAQGIFDAQQRAATANNPISIDTGTPGIVDAGNTQGLVPPAVQQGTDKVLQVQRAENAGSMPGGSTDLHLESLVSDLFNKYPEQKAAIADYVQSRGLDHYVFRDLKVQQAMQATEMDAQEKAKIDDFDYAVKGGLISAGHDINDGADQGQQLRLVHAKMAIAEKQYQMGLEERKFDITNGEYKMKIARQQAVSATVGEINQRIGLVMQPLYQFASGHTSPDGTIPTDILGRLDDARAQTHAVAEQYRAAYKAKLGGMGADPEQLKAIDTEIDTALKGMDETFTAKFGQNKNVLDAVTNTFKLSVDKAMPMYYQLNSILGPQAMSMAFGPNGPVSQLPQNIRDQLTKEAGDIRWGGALNPQFAIDLQRVLKGQLPLASMDASTARQHIPMMVASVASAYKSMQAGEFTPQVAENFHNSLQQLTIEADKVATPSVDFGTYRYATSVVSSPGVLKALEGQLKDPEHETMARAELQATRSTSQKLLLAAQQGGGNMVQNQQNSLIPNAPSPYRIVYQGGMYQVVADRDAYNKWAAANQPGKSKNTIPVPGWDQYSRVIPQPLRDKAESMNMNLNYLIQSSKYDPNIPGSAQARDLADHYAIGKPLGDTHQWDNKTRADFDTEFNKYMTNLNSLPTQIADNPDLRLNNPKGAEHYQGAISMSEKKYGIPQGLQLALHGQESGYDPEAGKGTPHVGIGQFDQATAQRFGLKGPNGEDLRTDPFRSIDATSQYLKILHDKYGSWMQAIQHYGTFSSDEFKKHPEKLVALKNKFRALAGENENEQSTSGASQ